MAKTTEVLVVLASITVAGSGGWIAWKSNRAKSAATADASSARNELAKSNKALTDCKNQLEDEKSGHELSAAAATSASATLTASATELEELRKQHEEAEKRLAAFKAMTDKFRKMIDSGKLQVAIRGGRMIVKLPASVLFASGSAELSKEGQTAIADVAHILRQFRDRRFMVAGHTDNIPIGPSAYKNNWELSTARALTVTQTLVKSGLSPTKLVAAGYGEYDPVKSNGTEAGRHENRRIEIVLLPNLAELPQIPDTPAPSASANVTH
ncbi:MAG: OmpA/MotB family protein [Polyangiales bacterium]